MAFNTDAILLLPPLLCDSRSYYGAITRFESEVEVSVANMGQDDNFADMAARAIENMPDRFALVGNSMGGYLALEIAARAQSRISHLALIGTNAHADSAEAQQKRMRAIDLAEGGKFNAFVDGYAESALGAGRRQQYSPLMHDMARDMGPDVFVRQQKAIMGRKSHEASLHSLSMPSLVMFGHEDSLLDHAHQRDMAKRLPDCRYVEVPRCGHMVPLEAAAMVNAALALLISV